VPFPRPAISLRSFSIAAALATVLTIAPTRPLHAQTSPTSPPQQTIRRHPYRVHLAADLSVTLAAAALWGAGQLAIPPLVYRNACPCAAGEVPGIDRFVAGHYDPTISLVSDIGMAALVALPLVVDLIDVRTSGGEWSEFLEDALVITESIALSGMVNQTLKLGVQRPRPLTYGLRDGDPLLSVPDNFLSFYSAHTSTAFAATMSFAFTYLRRHPGAPAGYVVMALAAAFAGTEGALRVAAGKHFPTDVLVGAAAGTLFGLAIPWLHTLGPTARVALTPTPGGLSTSLAFAW
jgi:membrane-associated phospholipid phosphatase